jgi:acyl-coenzyme A thioesterase PaaI-like protein
MPHHHTGADAQDGIRRAVLAGMALDRRPGFSFTGYFLDTGWPRIAQDGVTVTMPAGPHCTDARGEVELTALLMTLDAGLATPTRLHIRPGERLATAHMHAQFSGAPARSLVTMETGFAGLTQGDAAGQLLARGSASADGATLCHGSASFVRLPPPPDGRVLAPLPWQDPGRVPPAPLTPADLDPREQTIMAACEAALADTAHLEASFLRRFWGLLPQQVEGGAQCRTATGPHMANRVGHVQGGILVGLAAETARAAVPRHPVFSNISAWFISPGKGAFLDCRATIVHQGRSFAVVRSEITGEGGVRVLEAMTAHASAA